MNPFPHPDSSEDAAGTLERRTDERQLAEAQITVQVDTSAFGGHTKNVSQAGAFFFSEDRLRVTVQIEDGAGRRVAQGHLVRVERLDAQTTGYAIEFDQ